MVVWGGGQAVTTISDKSVNPLLFCILLEENCRNMFHVTVIEFDYMKNLLYIKIEKSSFF